MDWWIGGLVDWLAWLADVAEASTVGQRVRGDGGGGGDDGILTSLSYV